MKSDSIFVLVCPISLFLRCGEFSMAISSGQKPLFCSAKRPGGTFCLLLLAHRCSSGFRVTPLFSSQPWELGSVTSPGYDPPSFPAEWGNGTAPVLRFDSAASLSPSKMGMCGKYLILLLQIWPRSQVYLEVNPPHHSVGWHVFLA